MSPRSSEQFEAIRQKSRQAILDAALHLFARQGYAQTTTDEIAKRARISKGLIYNYFSSKEQILECLVVESLGNTFSILSALPEDFDPCAVLKDVIHASFELIRSNSDLLRLGLQLHTTGVGRKLFRDKQEELVQTYMRGLSEIFRRLGSSHPEMDTIIMGSIIDGISLNYTAAPWLLPLDDVEKHIIKTFCTPRRKSP